MLLKAMDILDKQASESCWYVGDSTTDVIAAKEAGVTSIFYNGAGWDQAWLDKIFPHTVKHPHRPDAVVGSIAELTTLARHLLAQHKRGAGAPLKAAATNPIGPIRPCLAHAKLVHSYKITISP